MFITIKNQSKEMWLRGRLKDLEILFPTIQYFFDFPIRNIDRIYDLKLETFFLDSRGNFGPLCVGWDEEFLGNS